MTPATISLKVLSTEEASQYQSMTFPKYRSLLCQASETGPVLAVLVEVNGESAGLALGRRNRDSDSNLLKSGEVLSLFVKKTHRGQWLSRQLLQRLSDELHQRGCRNLSLVYMTGGPSQTAIEALLVHQGWSEPELRMLVFKTELERLRHAHWLNAVRLPKKFDLVHWRELSSGEREKLKRDQQQNEWIPKDLDPFLFEGVGVDGSPPEPACSLALKEGSRVCGWVLSHRLDGKTVRFSCGFVRPDLQAVLLLMPIYLEAGSRARDIGYEYASWTVPHWHKEMARFARNRMPEYCVEFSETRSSHKCLVSD